MCINFIVILHDELRDSIVPMSTYTSTMYIIKFTLKVKAHSKFKTLYKKKNQKNKWVIEERTIFWYKTFHILHKHINDHLFLLFGQYHLKWLSTVGKKKIMLLQ